MDNKYDNTGAFWARGKKENDQPGKKYPAFEGKMTVGGQLYYLGLWVNEQPKEGQPKMSFKINKPGEKPKGDGVPF